MSEYFYYFTIYYNVSYKSLEDIIAYMTQFTFTKNVILLTIPLHNKYWQRRKCTKTDKA